jgi:endonuclease/exonuclease/phosphatase family metal-dependent hydrolase
MDRRRPKPADEPAPDTHLPATAIRVVTINTGKCDGPYRARLRWLISELARLEPDIIALQEAFIADDGSAHTPRELAARLGMQVAVARARLKERICEGRPLTGWSGLALLGRRPWTRQDVLRLPADERDGERIALFGVTSSGGHELTIANTHLTHLRDADALRRTQLEAVLHHPLLRRTDGVRLLCGDLNTMPDGPVLSPYLAGTAQPRLLDTYLLGGGTEPRGTLTPRPNTPDPTHNPCIDFILMPADGPDAAPSFRDSRVVLNRPRPATGIYPSDHYSVITTVVLSHRAH